MNKHWRLFLFILAVCLGVHSPAVMAQAPDSIAGRAAVMRISSGSGPFASSGSFRMLISATDNTYGIVSLSYGVVSSYGTATYYKANASTFVANANDVVVGTGLQAQYVFQTPTSGTFTITAPAAPGASQTGTFEIYNGQPPSSVAGMTFSVQIQAGAYPFESYGGGKIVTASKGSTYQILDLYGRKVNEGTYTYAVSGAGTSSLVLRDSLLGVIQTQTLSWDSSSTGAYVIRDSGGQGYQAGTFSMLETPRAPEITVQPANKVVTAGAEASFSVSASGTGSLWYQWQKDGVDIFGANQSSYRISAADQSSVGAYQVTISNYLGAVKSNAATLTVLQPPRITAQPVDARVAAGASAGFSVDAAGSGTLRYQWQKDGKDIAGANSATIRIAQMNEAQEGLYTVIVQNDAGRLSSNPARLSISRPPKLLPLPVELVFFEGNAASLTVAASGAEPLSFQWKKDGVPIDGAVYSTLPIATFRPQDAGMYSVSVWNVDGELESSKVTVKGGGRPTVAILHSPSGTGANAFRVMRSMASSVSFAVAPVLDAGEKVTYALYQYSGNLLGSTALRAGTVPENGEATLPGSAFASSGRYVLQFTRWFGNGTSSVSVFDAPFVAEVFSTDSAAGSYEALLEERGPSRVDSAFFRGMVSLTVTKSGLVSGRLLYNEAPRLPGGEAQNIRFYQPVVRSFSGTFIPSASDPLVLVCEPKLGSGAVAERQKLRLEMDVLNGRLTATVRDRASARDEAGLQELVSASEAVPRIVGSLEGMTVGSATATGAASRYTFVDAGFNRSSVSGVSGSLLLQVLPSGRLVWNSRIAGLSGSGSAGLRSNGSSGLAAALYEGRLSATKTLFFSSSLLSPFTLEPLSDGSWRPSLASASGALGERQSSYVEKVGDTPRYSAKFEAGAEGTNAFNWSCVSPIGLQGAYVCQWRSPLNGALTSFFSKDLGSSNLASPPVLLLQCADPAGEGLYSWNVTILPNATLRVAKVDPSQPQLQLRFDRAKGEFTGSYVSPKDKIRRNLYGVVLHGDAPSNLRAQGWAELNGLPATLLGSWTLVPR